MKVGDRSILEHIWYSWNEIAIEKVAILATTDRTSDNDLAQKAKDIGYQVYRGDVNDVLSRFQEISEVYKIDVLLRFTGDNPFIDARMVTKTIEVFMSEFTEDKGYFLSTRNSFMPIGMDIEIFSRQTLGLVPEYIDSYNKEHVTPWMYSHDKICKLLISSNLPKSKYSVTVDTIEQLETVREIHQWLGNRMPTCELISSFFENKH